jgi:hypothetical protein
MVFSPSSTFSFIQEQVRKVILCEEFREDLNLIQCMFRIKALTRPLTPRKYEMR